MECCLTVLAGPHKGQEVCVDELPVVIGRKEGDLVFELDGYISKVHTKLERASTGKLVVQDLGSKSGTLLNGRRIARKATVASGDCIEIGHTRFTVSDRKRPPPTRGRLSEFLIWMGVVVLAAVLVAVFVFPIVERSPTVAPLAPQLDPQEHIERARELRENAKFPDAVRICRQIKDGDMSAAAAELADECISLAHRCKLAQDLERKFMRRDEALSAWKTIYYSLRAGDPLKAWIWDKQITRLNDAAGSERVEDDRTDASEG